jgi:uncharacterized membrane protein (DUF4010 family)
MFELNEPLKLILSFAIGAVIGLERQENKSDLRDIKNKSYAPLGLRTFSMIAALGCLSGLLIGEFLLIALFISITFAVLLITHYIFNSNMTKDIGITTELALLYSYLIGLIIAIELLPMQVTLAISVVLLLILSRKEQIKGFIADVQKKEINAFISFAIIALVILPFLPNNGYTITDIPNVERIVGNFGWDLERVRDIEILNPFKLWTIVALITGVDLFGYVLERKFGKSRGWLFASLAGGFISSTATTLSLAQESKTAKQVNHLVSAAVFANMASFFQIAFLILVLNVAFFIQSIPVILLVIASSFIAGVYFYRHRATKNTKFSSKNDSSQKEIINLGPALKFAGLFLIIQLISRIALEFFGQSGFLAATAIGSLTGLDAVIINTSQLAGKQIEVTLAVIALILANAVNLTSKTIYSFLQGNQEFAIKFGLSMGFVALSSVVGLVITLAV